MNQINEPNEHHKTVKTYNVPGHIHFLTFSCFKRMPLLTNGIWLSWLGKSIRKYCDELDYALWAYVFMPEHVHILVKPNREKYDVSIFRKSIKQSVGKRVINSLMEQNSPILEKLRVNPDKGIDSFRFWQKGPGHDKNIWTIPKAQEKANYCHNNPVVRNLVQSPDQWKWSSFRWLEMNSRDKEPLRVDEWDETIVNEDGTLGGIGNPGLEFDPETLKIWNK